MVTLPTHVTRTAYHERSPLHENALLRVIKRVSDAAGSLALMVALFPVLLVVATLVLLIDGSPLIYRRRVVGADGEFDAFKFRTMRRDSDHLLATDSDFRRAYSNNFKLKSDPRITKLGRWLRKYSLDELPQLLNALMGQMSLVGPRMITAPELEKYGESKSLLLTVKPGLTGYWQVHGRQDVSYEERVRMDVHYITNWTLTMDVRLLLLTPLRVIRGKGAY